MIRPDYNLTPLPDRSATPKNPATLCVHNFNSRSPSTYVCKTTAAPIMAEVSSASDAEVPKPLPNDFMAGAQPDADGHPVAQLHALPRGSAAAGAAAGGGASAAAGGSDASPAATNDADDVTRRTGRRCAPVRWPNTAKLVPVSASVVLLVLIAVSAARVWQQPIQGHTPTDTGPDFEHAHDLDVGGERALGTAEQTLATCDPLEPVPHSSWVCKPMHGADRQAELSAVEGDVCWVQCDEYFTPTTDGAANVTCTADGWSGTWKGCVAPAACAGSKLGATPSSAGESCAAIAAAGDACGAPLDDGVYFVLVHGRPRRRHCDMTVDGGGWMFVNLPGRSVTDTLDLLEEQQNGYTPFRYDLSGFTYEEVMARVVPGHAWCNSECVVDASKATDFFANSMGIQFAESGGFHYLSGHERPCNEAFLPKKLPFSTRVEHGVGTHCDGCAKSPSETDVQFTELFSSGSAVKIKPPTGKNTYLQLQQLDAWIGTGGGCLLPDDLSSRIQVFVRTKVSTPGSRRAEQDTNEL